MDCSDNGDGLGGNEGKEARAEDTGVRDKITHDVSNHYGAVPQPSVSCWSDCGSLGTDRQRIPAARLAEDETRCALLRGGDVKGRVGCVSIR